MRIGDWRSDVCSSDLVDRMVRFVELAMAVAAARRLAAMAIDERGLRGLEEITFGMGDRGGVGAANDAEENVLERSEERRVGKECVSTGRSRGSTHHNKNNNIKIMYLTVVMHLT